MHLTEGEIEKLLANRLQPADQKRVVRHLLAGCGLCSRKLLEGAPGLLLEKAAEDRHRKTVPSSPHGHALAAALEQEAHWSFGEAKLARSLELLGQSPQSYDGTTLRQIRGLDGPSLVEALLRRSFEMRFRDPKAMLWLAYRAVSTIDSAGDYRPIFNLELRARAWGGLANAYRINEGLAEAEAALGRVRILLRQGNHDPRLLAESGLVEAILRTSQRRLIEADELYSRIYRLYLKLGEEHLAGRTLISRGIALYYQGSSSAAVRILRKAALLLDPGKDPELGLIGMQNLIEALIRSGAYSEAGQLLLKSGLRQAFARDPMALLQIRWTEARLLGGIGKSLSAAKILTEVRNEFIDLGQEYQAALVGLDTLPFWLQAGKPQAISQVARDVYGVLRAVGLHHEATEAWRYLQ